MTDSFASVAERPHSTPKFSSRIANADDTELLAAILADAFVDDPVVRWIIPDTKYDQKFFAVDLRQAYLPHEHCWVLDGAEGAACWLPPEAEVSSAPLLPLLGVFVPIILKHGFQCVKRGGVIESVFAKHRPTKAHYYLHMLGARHDQQGKGVGSTLLNEGLKVVDEHGMPAYLESSNEKTYLSMSALVSASPVSKRLAVMDPECGLCGARLAPIDQRLSDQSMNPLSVLEKFARFGNTLFSWFSSTPNHRAKVAPY